MSSLWTPGGEHDVPRPSTGSDSPTDTSARDAAGGASAGGTGGSADADQLKAAAEQLGLDLDSLTEEEVQQLQAELSEMMRVRREMSQTPAADMVANHLMRLFDLATIYLEAEPPQFEEAATVIESFRAVVENVGDRLGQHRSLLREALSQLQLVFVQVKEATGGSDEAP